MLLLAIHTRLAVPTHPSTARTHSRQGTGCGLARGWFRDPESMFWVLTHQGSWAAGLLAYCVQCPDPVSRQGPWETGSIHCSTRTEQTTTRACIPIRSEVAQIRLCCGTATGGGASYSKSQKSWSEWSLFCMGCWCFDSLSLISGVLSDSLLINIPTEDWNTRLPSSSI